MTDTEVIRKSVTAGDYATDPQSGGAGVYYFMAPQSYTRPIADLLPYWSLSRDAQLRSTVQMEAYWAAAIHKAITKRAARGFTLDDPQDKELQAKRRKEIVQVISAKTLATYPAYERWKLFLAASEELARTKQITSLRTKRAQALLLNAQAGHGTPGWVPFVEKQLRDFLTCDNGSFFEIVRATSAGGSRVIGIAHLDSLRCRRTGDPDIPVLYRDRKGHEHEMKSYQVVLFSDMPDSGDTYYGVGLCAASRSYLAISKQAAVERYVYEKVSGNRALALHFVQNVTPKQLDSAIKTAEAAQMQKGIVTYMGAIVVPVMGDNNISVVTVPLAELPDGFDPKQVLEDSLLAYASNIGMALQDLKPLSGQGLGTGTQTVILDEAADEGGLAAWDKQLTHVLNSREYAILSESTTFALTNTHDVRDQAAKANVASTRANERSVRIQSGEISTAMARQIAVDAGDLAPELIPNDETGAAVLDDDEKATEGVIVAAPLAAGAPNAPPKASSTSLATAGAPPVLPGAMPATKALRDELAAALALVEEVRGA